jgi:hypothetical protein
MPGMASPYATLPEEYNIGVLEAEDTMLRKSDLDAFKKAMKK